MLGQISSQISAQIVWNGRPRASGCLSPRISTYESLYRKASSGPQATNMGNFECSIRLTTERSATGQFSRGPSGERDQSCARIIAPIWPPSITKAGSVAAGIGSVPRLSYAEYSNRGVRTRLVVEISGRPARRTGRDSSVSIQVSDTGFRFRCLTPVFDSGV